MDEPIVNNPETHPSGTRRWRLRASDIVLGAVAGVLVALVAIVAVIIVSRRQSAPPLTNEVLEVAQRRWQQSGPAEYHMDLVVTGRQASTYHVEVRDGKGTQVLRNQRPTTPRTWHYWTVPGLFEVMEHDIDCSDDPTRGFGASPGSRAVLRAEFDPELGYPLKFERLILGEPHLDMTWQIIRFQAGGGRQPEESAASAEPHH